jgi:hypothetical protein
MPKRFCTPLFFLLILLCGCAHEGSSQRQYFEGGSIIAPGYVIRGDHRCGPDIASGLIETPKKSSRIFYWVYPDFNAVPHPDIMLQQLGYKIKSTHTSGWGSTRRVTTLLENPLGHRTLVISYVNDGPAKFTVYDLSIRQAKEMERIVNTFLPKSDQR